MTRLTLPALAGLLLAGFAVPAAADSLSCQTTNGRTLCVHGSGSMNLSCSTVNGRTECLSDNRRLECRTKGQRTDCEAVAEDGAAGPPPNRSQPPGSLPRTPGMTIPHMPDGMMMPSQPQSLAAPVVILQDGQRLRVRAGGVDLDLD